MSINKRLPAAAMLVVAFALVAAACGTSDDTTTTAAAAGATTTTAAAAEETTTTEEATEEPEFGALGGVIVASGDEIQIRVSQVLSGANEGLGVPNLRGVELAVADYGDIGGHAVSIGTPQDSLCSAEGGQAVGQAIVAQEDVIGVIGTSCSSAGVAMSALISEAGMVMISPSNTSPALTSDLEGTAGSDYNPGYYRTAHNDLFQGAAVAEFVAEFLGVTTAATIHDGSSYAEGLVTAFGAAFEELGGTITTATAVSVGDTDMVPVLTEIAAGSPEVLFYPIFVDEGSFIAQQWDSVAGLEETTQIGADGILTDAYLEVPETLDNYLSGPNLDYGTNVSETGVNAESFLATYEETYGEAPTAVFWAHSYDATVLLLTAIEAVAVDVDGSLFIDRQLVRDALTATRDFAGIIGTMNCDDFGDCGANRIALYQNADPTNVADAYTNIVFEWEPS